VERVSGTLFTTTGEKGCRRKGVRRKGVRYPFHDNVPCYNGSGQQIDCGDIGPPYTITVTATADSDLSLAMVGAAVLRAEGVCVIAEPCGLVETIGLGVIAGAALGLAAASQEFETCTYNGVSLIDPEAPWQKICYYDCPSGAIRDSIQPSNTACPNRITFGP
jgi:hypothetical protein